MVRTRKILLSKIVQKMTETPFGSPKFIILTLVCFLCIAKGVYSSEGTKTATITVAPGTIGFSGTNPNGESSFENFRCFNNKNGSSRKISEEGTKTIGIQVSNRVTHQLTSRIFAIFLREILGYENVKLMDLHFENNVEEYKLFNTLQNLASPREKWPVPTINLEVWMHPDYRSIQRSVAEAGYLTNPGRFGWFVPEDLINKENINETEKVKLLHYTVLQYPETEYFENFLINDEVLDQLEKQFGFENIYIPKRCEGSSGQPCITVFSEFYNDTAFAEEHIEQFKFYTKIYWLGKNFRLATEWLHELYTKSNLKNRIAHNHYNEDRKFYILLHWTPSLIIDAKLKYELITMPRCEDKAEMGTSLCKYELTSIVKFYGMEFRKAGSAFWALEDFFMEKTQMKSLLKKLDDYLQASEKSTKGNETKSDLINLNGNIQETENVNLNNIYNRIACEWLRSNEKIYSSWNHEEENQEIIIGGIFPLSVKGGAYRGITTAVDCAVNAINRDKKILPNFNLSVKQNNGKCRTDAVMKSFIHYFDINQFKPVLGVLGPACSETVEPIAGISKHVHMPVISYSAEGASFSNREAYPYFFRTIGSNRQYEDVYLNLLKKFKWRRAAALTEDGQKYTEYISHLETILKQNDMELIMNKKFPRDPSKNEVQKSLLDLKRTNAKIIIADVYNDNAQLVLCEAYHLKMTATHGYVWFLPGWLAKSWLNGTNVYKVQNVSCTSNELYETLNGHFSLIHSPFGMNSSIMQENKTIGEWLNNSGCLLNPLESLAFTGFAYDAVWVYALAADKLLRENPRALQNLRQPAIAKRFTELISATDFYGLSGRIRFDRGGSRIDNINILQWVNGAYRKIGEYIPNVQEENLKIVGGKFELNENLITWLWKDGRPEDGSLACKMAGLAQLLRTDCENVTFIVITIACLLTVVLVSLTSFMFWKRKFDRKLKQSAKVMRNFGIDLLSPSMSKTNTLDKWEVPKDRVVINRRLGEGAFGTVYGGEAQITEGEWTAVAVKTLKIGASTEDRLDFLSEAEAMKRFDHKNIIKLLGVCLQTEPIYTIMEFMLYGDLKTFLLARRHLVHEKVADDSDISSKRLTMMALDVARGLSYLADQKYVHRDVACRNCLVNAQRVVKLGDFGMARPMFENDYYRFNRKGMLPVRWMAPESLALGLFTPASDIWSFGVLLYEIITFGSFPYQGLTNSQALEYIKSGKTLQIPSGTKPHLEGLMRACWSQEYKKRPTGSEIVEYISNYPRLLTPCLDVPLSSVQMPESESDQLELLPGLGRHHSSNNRNQTQTLDILTRPKNINNLDQPNECTPVDTLEMVNNDELKVHEDVCDGEGNSIYQNGFCINRNLENDFNVPLDTSNDENSINSYSPMAPLLRFDAEFPDNLSSKRYVPMYSSNRNKLNQSNNNNNINDNGILLINSNDICKKRDQQSMQMNCVNNMNSNGGICCNSPGFAIEATVL